MTNLRLPFLLLAIATAKASAGVEGRLVKKEGHQGKGLNTKKFLQYIAKGRTYIVHTFGLF